MNVEETKILCPWGEIAVKLWGDKTNEAILLFHGHMDNAGAFDNLIQLLPDSFYYICVDLPGHGRSSHFPPGVPIHSIDYVLSYRVVADYFQREKYILIGHSYGGQLALVFAQAYPKKVSKIVNFDTFYLYPWYPTFFIEKMGESHDLVLKLNKQDKNKRPVYSYGELLTKLTSDSRSFGRLTKRSAEPILNRMIEKVGEDRYVLTIDQRLKCFQNPSGNIEYVLELFNKKPVRCPAMVIIASNTATQTMYFRKVFQHFQNVGFEIVFVEGNHDVHNNHPERVAGIVTEFLLRQKNKL